MKANSMSPSGEVEKINSAIKMCENVLPKKSKNAVVLLGNTGAGKTTLFSILCGKKIKVVENPYEATLYYNLVDSNDPQKIGNSAKSCTSVPSFMKIKKITFFDTPGLEDNQGVTQQIINIFYIKKIFDISIRVKIVLVIDYNLITVSRGNGLGELFNHLLLLIPDKEMLEINATIVITRCPPSFTVKNFENIIKDLCTNNNLFQNSKNLLLNIASNPNRISLFKTPFYENEDYSYISEHVYCSFRYTLWAYDKINPALGESALLKVKYIVSMQIKRITNNLNELISLIKSNFETSNCIDTLENINKNLNSIQNSTDAQDFFNNLGELRVLVNSVSARLVSTPYNKIYYSMKLLEFYMSLIQVEFPLQEWKMFIPTLNLTLKNRLKLLLEQEKAQKAKEEAERQQQELKRLEKLIEEKKQKEQENRIKIIRNEYQKRLKLENEIRQQKIYQKSINRAIYEAEQKRNEKSLVCIIF